MQESYSGGVAKKWLIFSAARPHKEGLFIGKREGRPKKADFFEFHYCSYLRCTYWEHDCRWVIASPRHLVICTAYREDSENSQFKGANGVAFFANMLGDK